MKKLVTLGLFAICIFGSASTIQAQNKIGYVSADEIISLMPEAARIDSQLNLYQQALYQAANDKKAAFDEAVAKFYKDSATMSSAVKEVTRTGLQKQVQELSGAEQTIQQQFEQERQKQALPLQRKLQQAIQDVAKENGYTYIFPKESLLVMPPGEDIGSLVKRKLGIGGAARPAVPKK
ncbi:MAG: OmpH family outer membrane protein [Chitinophagaceae bacterium]|nr:OmpH family outer membrane protein [Chitinophagaceae bacterium]